MFGASSGEKVEKNNMKESDNSKKCLVDCVKFIKSYKLADKMADKV
jgi:hypothetical protein